MGTLGALTIAFKKVLQACRAASGLRQTAPPEAQRHGRGFIWGRAAASGGGERQHLEGPLAWHFGHARRGKMAVGASTA